MILTITKTHVILVVYFGLFRVEPSFWAEFVGIGAVDFLVSVDEPWVASVSMWLVR